MYNTPTKKNHRGGSAVNRILFRLLGAGIIIMLLITALKFSSEHQGFAGFVCFLFAIAIVLFAFLKKNPGAGAWLLLLSIFFLVLLMLAMAEL